MTKSTSSSSEASSSTVPTIAPMASPTSPTIPSTSTTISTSSTTATPPHKTRFLLKKATTQLTTPFKKPSPMFPNFSFLPTELRLKIWSHTLTPRVHELHPCANLYNNRMTFRSNASSTPSIFHACRESRLIALENYQLMEYTPNNIGSENGKGILRFYFAPKFDTLLLNSLMGLFVMFMLLEEGHSPDSILNTGGPTTGVMKGWERVAIDVERAQLITLLSGLGGHSPQPKFKKLLPNLKELVVAFDYTRGGKTRFRTSVWPGENGTTLGELRVPRGYHTRGNDWQDVIDACLRPLQGFLKRDYRIGGPESSANSAVGSSASSNTADASNPAETEEGNSNINTNPSNITQAEREFEIDERDIVPIDPEAEVPIITTAEVRRKRYVRGDLRYAFRWSCSLVGVRPRGVFRRL